MRSWASVCCVCVWQLRNTCSKSSNSSSGSSNCNSCHSQDFTVSDRCGGMAGGRRHLAGAHCTVFAFQMRSRCSLLISASFCGFSVLVLVLCLICFGFGSGSGLAAVNIFNAMRRLFPLGVFYGFLWGFSWTNTEANLLVRTAEKL